MRGLFVDEWFNNILRQLALCSYPQETISILSRNIYLVYKARTFLAKCLSEVTTDLSVARMGQMAKVGK